MTLGDGSGALVRLRELLPAASALGDATVASMCLSAMATAEANAGHLRAATEHGAAAVREAESVRSPQALMTNHHVLYAWVLEEQDLLPEALAVVERLAAAAPEHPRVTTGAQIERWRARAPSRPGAGTTPWSISTARSWPTTPAAMSGPRHSPCGR